MGLDEWMAAIEARVRDLEVGARAPKTSVRGGFTRWLPANGSENPKIFIGQDSGGDDVVLTVNSDGGNAEVYLGTVSGDARFEVRTPDANPLKNVFQIAAGVIYAPLISATWQRDYNTTVDTAGRPIVTSASYVTTHRAIMPITSGYVAQQVFVIPGAGCTMDLRLSVYDYFDQVTRHTVVERTGITTFTGFAASSYPVPSSLGDGGSPIGKTGLFVLEARRTAGANNCATAAGLPLLNSTA